MAPAECEPTAAATYLATPPVPPVAAEAAQVFDGHAWCASRDLEWRCPVGRWDPSTPIDGSNPARMIFVVRREASERAAFLPRETACLHAFGLGLTDEEALAPWAIDDATDELYAKRIEPRELFWLAADNLNALFWGLHDWAHFHNHGAFEPAQRAWTELQCDASALVWLWIAGETHRVEGLSCPGWEEVRRQAEELSRARFAADSRPFDPSVLGAQRLQAIAARARRS
jgi:hypothetical protein